MDVRIQIGSKFRRENIVESQFKVVEIKYRRRRLERVLNE